MQAYKEVVSGCRRASLVALTLVLGACTDSPRPTNPVDRGILSEVPISAAARAELDRRAEETRKVKAVIRTAAVDGRRNADKWFGRKGERSHERFCKGVKQLVSHYLSRADSAAGRPADEARHQANIRAALNGAGCGTATPMSVFGTLAPSPALPQGEEVDVSDALWSAIQSYGDYVTNYGPGDHEWFCAALPEVDAQLFRSTASRMDEELAYYVATDGGGGGGGGGGSEPPPVYSIFLQAGSRELRNAVVGGCIGGVTSSASTIVSGVRTGAAICGVWCAIAGGAAVAVESCGWGAIGGYLSYRARK